MSASHSMERLTRWLVHAQRRGASESGDIRVSPAIVGETYALSGGQEMSSQ